MIGKTFFHTVLIHCLLFSAVFGCLSEKKPRFLVTSPDSGNTAYGYDSAGNMTSSTDANNITVTYDYDALSRLTDINFPDSSQDISCGYDSGNYGIGKLTSVSDPAGSTSFDYNALGQITQETRTADSLAFDTVYGYDTVTTDLNALTYPSGLALTYQRDGNGRISGISADGQSIVSNVTCLPFGPVSGMTAGSLSLTRTFDQRYQVSGIAAGTVMNLTYTRDGAGNVKSISGVTKAPVAPGTTDYTLPLDSNSLSGSTGKTVKTYGYDNTGKITSDGTRTFIYNQNGQLIRVTAGSTVIAEYAYDGFARRVKKTVGSELTYFHYDYDGNLISETDGTGSPVRDYIYLNGEPVAMKLYGSQAGIYYFISDHLGTPQKVTDASGAIVWEAGYMPFGEARIKLADVVNNLRFPGQYYDSETGLHYNWNRYYDPDTGRYLTPDPIGLEGGLNLYIYVDGNPVNMVDPYGLIPLDTIWDIGNVIIDIVTGDKESLIFDSAAMMIPYLPAGATKVCKVGKAAKKPYTPNRRLPRNPKSNAPAPDVDVPHSQIGKPSDPKFGDYRQARSWDYGPDGRLKPKKDIDFTDHNNPLDHINPHQHRWSDEHHFPGKRGKQEPLN